MDEEKKPLNKSDVIEIIQEMINIYDNLPPEALFAPTTHQDHHTLLLLLLSVLRSEGS